MKKLTLFTLLILLGGAGCHQTAPPATSTDISSANSATHAWRDESTMFRHLSNRDLLPVEIGGKWGYIGRDGLVKITPQFGRAYTFIYDLAEVCVGECTFVQRGKHGLINATGQFVIPPIYDDFGSTTGDLISVCTGPCDWSSPDSKWGYVDRKGSVVISPQFGAAQGFSDGMAAVCVGSNCYGTNSNGKWGYIDKTGHFAINPQFDGADEMADGVASISMGSGKDKKTGYVDKTGKVIFTPSN